MNYLGHSIVDEVDGGGGGGGGGRNVANALNLDAAAMQAVLKNFKPAVSIHPYRFSNGSSTVYNYNLLSGLPVPQQISGLGTPSSYNLQMTGLNYKGAYAFKMVGRWWGISLWGANNPAQNSLSFRVRLGATTIFTLSPLLITNGPNVATQTEPLYIEINGIIEVLDSPGPNTNIQTTAKFELRNSNLSNFGFTHENSTLDLSELYSRQYALDLVIDQTIPAVSQADINVIEFTRLVGTLNCIYSEAYTG